MTHARQPQRNKPTGHAVADANRMTMTGFCQFPSQGSHGYCHEHAYARTQACTCPCHTDATPPSSEGFGEALFGPHVVPTQPEPGAGKIEGLDDELLSHILYGDGKPSPVIIDSLTALQETVLNKVAADDVETVLEIKRGRLVPKKGRMTVAHPDLQQKRKTIPADEYGTGRHAPGKLELGVWKDGRVTLDLPPQYYEHFIGGASSIEGHVIARLLRRTRVELDVAAYDSLLASAKAYALAGGSARGHDGSKISISAHATVKALEKVGRPA